MKKMAIALLLFAALPAVPCPAEQSSHRQTALELLEVTSARQMMDQMTGAIENMMDQQFAAMDLPPEGREAAERVKSELLDWMGEFFNWEQLRETYADIYVRVFTEEEIKELIAFYQSSLGRKMLAKMPELMQESMRQTQALLRQKMPELQRRMEKMVAELEAQYKNKQ